MHLAVRGDGVATSCKEIIGKYGKRLCTFNDSNGTVTGLIIFEISWKAALVSGFTTNPTCKEDCKKFHKCLESFHQTWSKLS